MSSTPFLRAFKVTAWLVCAITCALALTRVLLALIEPGAARTSSDVNVNGGGIPLAILTAVMLMAFAVLGAVVASRQARNPVGWLLGLIPLSFGLLFVADRLFWQVKLTTGHVTGITAYAAWLADWVWIPAIVPVMTVFPLLFPTGRPLSPRWRMVVWVAVIAGTMVFVGTAFVSGPLEQYSAVVNPLGIRSAAVKIIGSVGFALLVPTTVAAISSLAIRFRRSHGVERQQLKWVAASAVLLAGTYIAAGINGDNTFVIFLFGLLIVAVAVAVAMLRYRLYDIDVVINRALVYGALTATLAGAYLGSVLLLELVLSGVTAGNGLAVAGSTLAVAALFQPARRRIQAGVDRRFFRRRYDAARTLATFGAHLRDQVDLDALGEDLRGVVSETMQPQHVSLWLRGEAR